MPVDDLWTSEFVHPAPLSQHPSTWAAPSVLFLLLLYDQETTAPYPTTISIPSFATMQQYTIQIDGQTYKQIPYLHRAQCLCPVIKISVKLTPMITLSLAPIKQVVVVGVSISIFPPTGASHANYLHHKNWNLLKKNETWITQNTNTYHVTNTRTCNLGRWECIGKR